MGNSSFVPSDALTGIEVILVMFADGIGKYYSWCSINGIGENEVEEVIDEEVLIGMVE